MDNSAQKDIDAFIKNLANPKFRRIFELYLKTLYDAEEKKKFEADLKILQQLARAPLEALTTERLEQKEGSNSNKIIIPARVEMPERHIVPEPEYRICTSRSEFCLSELHSHQTRGVFEHLSSCRSRSNYSPTFTFTLTTRLLPYSSRRSSFI